MALTVSSRPIVGPLPAKRVPARPIAQAAVVASSVNRSVRDGSVDSIDQQVKSGQNMILGGGIGAGVSVAAGLGLAFAVNPILGIAVGALGALAGGGVAFLGLAKITAATD